LAKELQLPAWKLSRRAGQLGIRVVRLKQPDWQSAELRVLARYREEGAPTVRQELARAGFQRSLEAVRSKIKALGERLQGPANGEVFSAHFVASKMGVDEKTVVRWIYRGLAAAQTSAGWRITPRSLRAWIANHPFEIELSKIDRKDWPWFIALLAGK
jgi:hypothetical protein